jgi:hypothetical protein
MASSFIIWTSAGVAETAAVLAQTLIPGGRTALKQHAQRRWQAF